MILKPFAREFFSSYFEPKFDYPVDEKFFKISRIRKNLNTILFIGGSQGANFINNLALSLAKDLDKNGIKIIHQCGQKDYETIIEKYKELNIKAEVFAFSKDIDLFMSRADFCISRAGASTIWELCAASLPTLFIPFPYAANNHQFYNAKFLKDQDAAMVLKEDEIDNKNLLNIIYNLNLEDISQKLINLLNKNGSKVIIDRILQDC